MQTSGSEICKLATVESALIEVSNNFLDNLFDLLWDSL